MVAQRTSAEQTAIITGIENDLAVLRRVGARRDELRARVTAFEEKFGIRTSDIYAAIDEGRIVESAEVCDWIMADEILRRSAW